MNMQDYTSSPESSTGPHPVQQQHHHQLKHSNAGPVLGLVAALLFVGGGVFAVYQGGYLPFGQEKDPYQVLAETYEAMDNTSGYQIALTAELRADISAVKAAYEADLARYQVETARQIEERKTLEQDGTQDEAFVPSVPVSFAPPNVFKDIPNLVEITLETETAAYTGESESGSGYEKSRFTSPVISVSTETRTKDEKTYFQIDNIDLHTTAPFEALGPFFPVEMITDVIETVEGQWVLFDGGNILEEIFALQGVAMPEEVMQKQEDAAADAEQLKKELLQIFFETRPVLLTPREDAPRDLYVYTVAIDPVALQVFINQATAAAEAYSEETALVLSGELEDLEDLETITSMLDIVLAIDKRSSLFAWIQMDGEYETPETDEGQIQLTYSVHMEAGEYNQPVTVEEPADAKRFQDIVFEFLGLAMSESMTNEYAEEDSIGFYDESYDDTDGDGIEDFIENQFGTDSNNVDSDGDGYDDRTEILGGYNPLGDGRIDAEEYEIYYVPWLSSIDPAREE